MVQEYVLESNFALDRPDNCGTLGLTRLMQSSCDESTFRFIEKFVLEWCKEQGL
jgi:hypothetical protein